MRIVALLAAALLVAPPAAADPKQVKPDRRAIDRLLDAFVPDVVEQKNLRAGWALTGGYSREVSYRAWLRGDTSVQRYPARGTRFHGWTLNYSYPGDVGFDILLQPSTRRLGAWSFRAEAQRLDGRWRITTWYPVAEFAAPGQLQHVSGPADTGVGARFVPTPPRKTTTRRWLAAAAAVLAAAAALLLRRRRREDVAPALEEQLVRPGDEA
jgi:hypothetical protein